MYTVQKLPLSVKEYLDNLGKKGDMSSLQKDTQKPVLRKARLSRELEKKK
jgi:hypothetical protein